MSEDPVGSGNAVRRAENGFYYVLWRGNIVRNMFGKRFLGTEDEAWAFLARSDDAGEIEESRLVDAPRPLPESKPARMPPITKRPTERRSYGRRYGRADLGADRRPVEPIVGP